MSHFKYVYRRDLNSNEMVSEHAIFLCAVGPIR
jgi:hypothetical protein